MIFCKQVTCGVMGNRCCNGCTQVDCDDRCDMNAETCGHAEILEETTDLTLFQSNAMMIMREIANLDRMKKDLEVKDKLMRQELQAAMDKYGVKKFENDILKVTYVEPTVRETIDSKRLKLELPAVAAKYTKTSHVKASVRIEVK